LPLYPKSYLGFWFWHLLSGYSKSVSEKALEAEKQPFLVCEWGLHLVKISLHYAK
jgi:hypothetical protein